MSCAGARPWAKAIRGAVSSGQMPPSFTVRPEVFRGDQSWEEMGAGFVDFVIPAAAIPNKLLMPPAGAEGETDRLGFRRQ
jgi:hypothetical protein